MSSPILDIPYIATNQSQKEVTANEQVVFLEAAFNAGYTFECSDGTNAMTADEVRRSFFFVLAASSAGVSAAFDVELPAVERLVAFQNISGETATITCVGSSGSVGVTIADGDTALVYCDGSEVYALGGGGGGAPKEIEINAQTGTTYTLALSDSAKLVTLSNGSAITVTVPLNSSVAFPVGTQILFAQIGAGQVTFAKGDPSITITSPETLKLRKTGAQAALIKIDTNTWLLEGDLEAV